MTDGIDIDAVRGIPVKRYHTIIVGTGAAGYAATDCLYRYGVTDIAIVTEGRTMGTSRNTGSDKQTYYKLTLCGEQQDSVRDMAKTLFSGQCMDGEHALAESALSVKRFLKLADLGVPFPTNRYGEYVGYKTDHDPKQRAASIGPYTSRAMTQALEKAVLAESIPIYDQMQVVQILTDCGVCHGVVCLSLNELEKTQYPFQIFLSEFVIYATGGPAGIYRDSVYPESQHGASGVAFIAGAAGKNLTEWQYGIASVKPRWNVSGSYMQALPRFISVDQDGRDEREFLQDYLKEEDSILEKIFLKGYEWPFDVKKLENGSSLVDMAVYLEIVKNKRRVFLDYTRNPLKEKLDYQRLPKTVFDYLRRVDALYDLPFERLLAMNEPAVQFYRDYGIDLKKDRLEIAVCAQHNNGGLSVDLWWQTNIQDLFAIGEAAGTHGVYRPGGSALNAGQVGAERAALFILRHPDKKNKMSGKILEKQVNVLCEFTDKVMGKQSTVTQIQNSISSNMSEVAAILRKPDDIRRNLERVEWLLKYWKKNIKITSAKELREAFLVRDMLISQRLYLFAMKDYIEQGGKSRGSAVYCQATKDVDSQKNIFNTVYYEADTGEKGNIIQEVYLKNGIPYSRYRLVNPIPEDEEAFEKVWKKYRENGNVY